MKSFILIALLFMLAACNRKKEDIVLPAGASFHLVRIDYYADPSKPSVVRSTQYVYDANNRLTEVSASSPDRLFDSKVVYRWLSATTLRTESYYTNPPWSSSSSLLANQPLTLYSYSETVYSSDGSRQETKNYLVQNGKADYQSYTRHEYDSAKRVIRRNTYLAMTNQLASYTLLEYDSRGNVVRETLYTNVAQTTTPNLITTYEHDQAPNPYYTAQPNSGTGWYGSPNNVVRQKSVNLVSGINSDEQWRYEYRPDGYPARMLYADGRKEEFIYNQ